MPDLSILIPVLNEADSLPQLQAEIRAVAEQNGYGLQVVYVDNGSTDASWSVIQRLAAEDSDVTGLRFRRNFGKAAALRAAAADATHDLMVTMDADLQDDPHEIPKLLEKMGDDFDLVSGWKEVRNDPINKTLPSKLFNKLVGWMTGVKLNDHNCGFKVYRREIFDDVRLYGEMHRFVPVLASAHGYRVGEVAVNHRAREHGTSKYGWSRLPKGFLDLLTVSFLTGFNQRPQHLLGSVGLLSFVVGSIGMLWMAVYWVLRMTSFPDWEPLHQRPLVLYSLGALLLGSQLLCMGFLAELIVAKGQERKEPYSIRERTNGK
jgi:dolichol-phosphate mannosyltransferase